jgi:hypothetical protein
MMTMGAPGLDGCEPLMPTNRLLVFFLVGVGLCVSTKDILVVGQVETCFRVSDGLGTRLSDRMNDDFRAATRHK